METNYKFDKLPTKNGYTIQEEVRNSNQNENIKANDIEFEDKYFLDGIEIIDYPTESESSSTESEDESEDESDDEKIDNDDDDNKKEDDSEISESLNVHHKHSIKDYKRDEKNDLKQIFIKDFRNFFTANFLTSKAKEQIKNFITNEKYSKLSLDDKCEIINISRKTLYRYNRKDMSPKAQKERNQKKGKTPKLTEDQLREFLSKCRELRDSKVAVSTKLARKLIKQITSISGKPWLPCQSTISNIFRKNGWKRRKSQLRDPMSDPVDKEQKIEKFKKDLKKLIDENHLKRKNVHIMDETGLYSNSIAPYTWTFGDDTQAYVCTTGTKRRDTLVATISANGDGFATFIKHRNQKTKKVGDMKKILDPGCKGMNIDEMKKWVEEFKKYASKGDLLIMDNLTSHHNKEVIQELEQSGFNVLFIPPRCADVLSVLDNCFFAVFKAKWYEELILIENVEDKEKRAKFLFNQLIACGIGRRMYKKCGYNDFFDPNDKEIEEMDEIILRYENDLDDE